MNALSLFTGIGGLDLAAEAAGIEIAAMCEIDPFCRAVLNKRCRGKPVMDDIRRMDGSEWKGKADIVFGGFPCQDLSLAGANQKGGRAGLKGERSGLWFEMLRIVRGARPFWVLAENVRGAVELALDEVKGGLEDSGYEVRALVLPASAFGAPHRRERLFVLGMEKRLYARLVALPSWREKSRESVAPYPCSKPPRPDRWRDGPADGQLSAGWVEQLMGFPEGWTDLEEESPRAWAGFPAPMSEERLFATPTASDCLGSRCKMHRSLREDIWQIRHGEISPPQHPWELPRLVAGLEGKERKRRIKALGNAVVPQQAYPIFQAIAGISRLLGESAC